MKAAERQNRRSLFKRFLIWTPAVVFALIVLLLLFTQTRLFKNWLRDYAVDLANESLNGELAVGRLDGSLFKTVTLRDIVLRSEQDTMVTVASLHVRYDLWAVFQGVIQLDSIAIDSVNVRLEQAADSTWNLARLLPEDTAGAPVDSAESFGYAVVINDFSLNDAAVDIKSYNDIVPRRIEDIAVRLAAGFDSEKQDLNLEAFSLRTINPDFVVQSLTGEIAGRPDSISLKDFQLVTAMNRVRAEAVIYPDLFPKSTGYVRADSVTLAEFGVFLPEYLTALNPLLNFDTHLKDDTLRAHLTVIRESQQAVVDLRTGTVSGFLDTTDTAPPGYDAEINLNRIVLAEWLDNDELDIVLNGVTRLNGAGIEPENASINLTSNLQGTVIENIPIPVMNIDLAYDRGHVAGGVDIDGPFGKAALAGTVRDILDTAAYRLRLETNHFDIGRLGVTDSLTSDLTLAVAADGAGFNPDSLKGNLRFTLGASSVNGRSVSSGFASVAFSDERLAIDSFTLTAPVGSVTLAGTLSRVDSSRLDFSLDLTDLTTLAAAAQAEQFDARGTLTGTLAGTPDYMTLRTDAALTDIVYDGIKAASCRAVIEADHRDTALTFERLIPEKPGHLTARGQFDIGDITYDETRLSGLSSEFDAAYRDTTLTFSGRLTARGIEQGGLAFDSLTVTAAYDRNEGALDAELLDSSEDLQVSLNSRLKYDSLITVFLNKLSIAYQDLRWRTGDEPAVITVDKDSYTLENFALVASAPDGAAEQALKVNGAVDLNGETRLTAVVNNLYLKPLASKFDLDLEGVLSAEFSLGDSLANPGLTGNFGLTGGRYLSYRFNRIDGDLKYRDRLADFKISLIPTPTESLTVAGRVPYVLPPGDTLAPLTDSAIAVDIHTDKLSLEVLKTIGYTIEKADGYFTCDFHLANTLANPQLTGETRIKKGSVTVPEYGIEYTGIEAGLSFMPNRIKLDSLVVLQNKGKLHLSGSLDYDSSLIAGDFASSELALVTKDFYAVRHRHYEVQLTSDVILEGTDTVNTYGGTMTVNRSRFYLPALLAETADTLDDLSRPMLLTAVEPETSTVTDSPALEIADDKTKADSAGSVFMKNLRGSLKVSLPKNTWIKSPDLQMELSGDIDIVKKDADFELFGNIEVVRGHYDLYGKRFKVKRGVLVFQGGAEYNPTLDIETEYVLRTAAREKKTLRLYVTGTAEVPVLRFTLDEEELTEGDAVSYILFGRSLDELSHGQRTSVTGNSTTGEKARGLAAGLLAGQLTKALGNRLNLDVIEIKAEGDLQSAAIVIGKYLTPDLFMSYQRSFGSATDNDLEPEIVTLEYQLTRLFYLQLTEGDAEDAGFDIIMKLQKE